MAVEQLDLFATPAEEPKKEPERSTTRAPQLNGMYYERSTGLFVSFVQGRRYWEGSMKGQDAEWQKYTKTHRAI